MFNLESGSDDGEMPAIGWHPQQASQDFQTPDVAAAAKAAAPKEAASPGGRVPVFNIYRYARFERIKQLAQKNQKWYLIPLKYQYHSQSCNQK